VDVDLEVTAASEETLEVTADLEATLAATLDTAATHPPVLPVVTPDSEETLVATLDTAATHPQVLQAVTLDTVVTLPLVLQVVAPDTEEAQEVLLEAQQADMVHLLAVRTTIVATPALATRRVTLLLESCWRRPVVCSTRITWSRRDSKSALMLEMTNSALATLAATLEVMAALETITTTKLRA